MAVEMPRSCQSGARPWATTARTASIRPTLGLSLWLGQSDAGRAGLEPVPNSCVECHRSPLNGAWPDYRFRAGN